MKNLITLFLILPVSLYAQESDYVINMELSNIAVGSCSDQKKVNQQLWEEVSNEDPDLWIWLGDNVYSDGTDMQRRTADFDKQKNHPGYKNLLQQATIIGTWDDHDYGVNDGGKEYPKKDEAKEALFHFLEVPTDHPAWSRQGTYQSYTFSGSKKVKVILLDTRYFRDELKWENRYSPDKAAMVNPEGTILGEAQWTWLSAQLGDQNADLILLISSIQLIPYQHRFEKWANFPKERERMLKLLGGVETPLVVISGDRHISEISSMSNGPSGDLYEITSSSLTNPWSGKSPEQNEHRIGEIIYNPNFTVLRIQEDQIQVRYVGKSNEVLATFEIDLN